MIEFFFIYAVALVTVTVDVAVEPVAGSDTMMVHFPAHNPIGSSAIPSALVVLLYDTVLTLNVTVLPAAGFPWLSTSFAYSEAF